MRNTFVQSIKSIAQSLIDRAGYDKTRTGTVVGTNELTNTYSVKVDGKVYNNLKAMDGNQYNVHDIVKVVIPCNQATQMYISSSAFSDNSLGNRVAHAQSVADSKNKTFRQATAPTPSDGLVVGDIWIDTTNGNKMYRWDGSQWVISGGGDPVNTATIILYQRASTAPSTPSGGQTYTFSTGVLSPIPTNWSRNIPSGNDPCYSTQTTVTSFNDNVGVVSWTAPILLVRNGTDGQDAPNASVTITVNTISYLSHTATLGVILFVDGAIVTPTSYQWGKDGVDISGATNSTLGVTDLDAVYYCTVTWSD